MTTIEYARKVLDAYETRLFENPNVAFVSVVPGAETIDLDGDEGFHLQVGVYDMARQLALVILSAEEDLPISQMVPASLSLDEDAGGGDVIVELVETDEIRALSYTDKRRPAEGGNSTSVYNLGGSGTLGAKVTVNGREGFFLTNWHVAHGGRASGGSVQVQPGQGDGGSIPRDRIGMLHWWALNQYLDAAIVRADQPNQLSYVLRCWGNTIRGTANPSNGMSVKKCGRTSRATTGRILSTTASVRVGGYPGGTRVFSDQIQMTFMLRPGDSGSVLLSAENRAVGLCFAGSNSHSFANKFSRLGTQAIEGNSINADGSIVSGESVKIGFGENQGVD